MTSSIPQLVFIVCLFAADEDLDKARLEKFLADPDGAELIVQSFRRHPDDVLGFIDEYMEGGLKMIEEGKSEDEAMNSFRVGVKFGKLADRAFGETVFTEYTASFASWSPAERKRFREGQWEYRAGKEAMKEPAKALEHFEKSLKLAEPLGDSWGTAMALGGIVEARIKLELTENMDETYCAAIQLNRRLRLRKALIGVMLTYGEAMEYFGAAQSCGQFNYMDELLAPNDTSEFRKIYLERVIRILEKQGLKDQIDLLRQRNKLEVSSASQPAKE